VAFQKGLTRKVILRHAKIEDVIHEHESLAEIAPQNSSIYDMPSTIKQIRDYHRLHQQ
jgi:hypothetical protein